MVMYALVELVLGIMLVFVTFVADMATVRLVLVLALSMGCLFPHPLVLDGMALLYQTKIILIWGFAVSLVTMGTVLPRPVGLSRVYLILRADLSLVLHSVCENLFRI